MSCPFIDKRYGQNFCDATDGYIQWESYCDTCSKSCDYESCENYKREDSKRQKLYFISSYQI
jgi:hypothetical protein